MSRILGKPKNKIIYLPGELDRQCYVDIAYVMQTEQNEMKMERKKNEIMDRKLLLNQMEPSF